MQSLLDINPKKPRLALCAIMTGVFAALLLGCAKTSNPAGSSGQVAAHVGPQVVTTLEIETEMRAESVPMEKRKDPTVMRHALNELILRKYLVQQAVAEKLDREPDVLLAVLRSREQTLANTVIAREVANKPVNKADTDRYIAANPGEFAERKMLTIEQIRFALGPATRGLSEANKTMKTLDDVDQQLNALGVEHTRSVSLMSRSEVPPSLVALLDARKPDEVFYARSRNRKATGHSSSRPRSGMYGMRARACSPSSLGPLTFAGGRCC